MYRKAQGCLEHLLVAQLCPEAQDQTRHPAFELISRLEPPAGHEQIYDRHLERLPAHGAERLRPVPHQADPSALAAQDQGQGTTTGGVGIDQQYIRSCLGAHLDLAGSKLRTNPGTARKPGFPCSGGPGFRPVA